MWIDMNHVVQFEPCEIYQLNIPYLLLCNAVQLSPFLHNYNLKFYDSTVQHQSNNRLFSQNFEGENLSCFNLFHIHFPPWSQGFVELLC